MLKLKPNFQNPWLIILVFIILAFALKSPILNTPHYWDSLNRVHNAHWIKTHSFNPFLKEGEGLLSAQGRPPFFLELLAVFWTLFGDSLYVSHLVVVIFSFLGLLFTYLLGKHFFSSNVGFFSSLLLFFSPLYFAQSGILNYAVPLTALSVMVVYFALTENKVAYFISASCLVLTKETGMLILIPVLLALLWRYRKQSKSFKNILVIISPFFVYLLWLLACKIYHGWFLFPGHAGILNLSSLSHIILTLKIRVGQLFFKNYHWLLSLVILAASVKWIKTFLREKEKGIILIGAMAIYLIFFALYPVPLDRYLLPVYPLFFMLFFQSVDFLSKQDWRPSFIAFLVITSLFIMNWTGKRSTLGHELETNLEYLDFIEVHQKAAQFIESHYPDKYILTDWPQTMELRYPFEGYVESPVRASSIFEDYDLQEVDLIYFVPQSVEEFINLVDQLELELVAEFEKNGKGAEIYRLIHKE